MQHDSGNIARQRAQNLRREQNIEGSYHNVARAMYTRVHPIGNHMRHTGIPFQLKHLQDTPMCYNSICNSDYVSVVTLNYVCTLLFNIFWSVSTPPKLQWSPARQFTSYNLHKGALVVLRLQSCKIGLRLL